MGVASREHSTVAVKLPPKGEGAPLTVERTFAWLNRNRRLAKDFEALLETAATWLMLASVKLLMRRLARA